jgi:hypothetical protein
LGIDSDNGSEFINHHLFNYCTEHEITFTRSRSGNKNDGAHVEQKNWTHVRELVGYLRFDTDKELSVLNEIWALDMGYTNYLLAQQKLVFKQRDGSKVTKRYDRATTPLARTKGPPRDRRNGPGPPGEDHGRHPAGRALPPDPRPHPTTREPGADQGSQPRSNRR